MTPRERLEAWLSSTTPVGSTQLADRLFIRTLMRDEQDLARLRPRVVEHWTLGDQRNTDAYILAWCMRELGESRFLEELAHVHPRWDQQRIEHEPWLSTYLYWVDRCGFASSQEPGALPAHPLLHLYADFHTIFFAAHYGASPTTLDDASPSLRSAADYLPRIWMNRAFKHNADLLAEACLAELCLVPRRETTLRSHLARLLPLQQRDGSFTPSPDATPTARHHASVVTALVLWMLDRPGQ